MKVKTNREIGDEVRSRYAAQLQSIRGDDSRTPEWRQTKLAWLYVQMRDERDRQVVDRDAKQGTDQLSLERRLFGVGSVTGDAASLIISRRDAGDRVATLEEERTAMDLLARANRSGDEPLARAIAEKAYQERWVDTTNAFLATHPELGDDMNELWAQPQSNAGRGLVAAMELDVSLPELQGMAEYKIDALAATVGEGGQL